MADVLGAARAVVTVAYRSDDVLGSFLASIPDASSEAVRVVVVDNLGSDATRRAVEGAGAEYLPRTDNPGYGGAVNEAVRTLPAEVRWVVVANPDVVLGERSIDGLVAAAETDETIGAVGPGIRDADGTLYPSARRIPSLRLGIGHALLSGIWPANPWTRAYREESSPYRRDAGWLSGACLLVRRTAFDGIGGFDDRYFMYFEDVDLGYRLGRAGWRNVYEPGAEVVHSGAHSTATDSAAMIEAHHRSALRFVRAKYPGPVLLPVRLVVAIGLRARSFVVRRSASR